MRRIAPILLEWYAREGRDLPWRRTRDPYRIWLSEVILQQTRVAQGMDYYLRFTQRWPEIGFVDNSILLTSIPYLPTE